MAEPRRWLRTDGNGSDSLAPDMSPRTVTYDHDRNRLFPLLWPIFPALSHHDHLHASLFPITIEAKFQSSEPLQYD